MAATKKITKQLILSKISDLYRIGLSCSIIPSLCAALLVLDAYTIHVMELMPFVMLLCIVFPLALIGLFSIVTGLKLASRIENEPKITAGTYSLIVGIALFIGQLCSFVFVFLKIM
ncbi:hypothetical protein [Cytophaga aurantiaca]|uniref:hypothetical protein n=1 Tax=Cytophaga aurantiaca TaxID=29530 RepID=UPI000477D082|nr:hypothetical protein [Cytophaga aurantiaca]